MVFGNPKIRQAFIELHPARSIEGAKYKVGDLVMCFGAGHYVEALNHVEEGQFEYLLEGLDHLVWEDEIR